MKKTIERIKNLPIEELTQELKSYSIEFLDKCLEDIQSISQEEFDKKIKEIGIDKFTYDLIDCESDFKIIFNKK